MILGDHQRSGMARGYACDQRPRRRRQRPEPEARLDVLGAAGFRTFGAETAAQGIALAREHVPDVILMDLSFPTWMASTRRGGSRHTSERLSSRWSR